MQVEVRCYGAVRGAIGAKSIELDFEERATVGDVLDALAARSESDFPTDAVVMRDRRHLDRETTIAGGDVVSVTDSPMPEG